jgi:hypothetical protein
MATKSLPVKKRVPVRTCPHCGHHTLLARGQILVCRSCQTLTWRSES